MENICERLFERFPTWGSNITSNIEIEKEIFSKTKLGNWRGNFLKNINKKKTFKIYLDEKKLPFHDALDHFVFLYIPTACHRRSLPCVIKDSCSEGIQNSLTNEGLILDQLKITPLCCCCPFSTLLGFSARKCCIIEKQSSRSVLWNKSS